MDDSRENVLVKGMRAVDKAVDKVEEKLGSDGRGDHTNVTAHTANPEDKNKGLLDKVAEKHEAVIDGVRQAAKK